MRQVADAAVPPVGRVLVVDDEQPLARMVATYLERAGHRVTVAHTGPGALEAARAAEPDVVVLDLGLPGMDGIEVCRRLRDFSSCYVVILTARGQEQDKLEGLAVGADDYLTKPFSVRELVARVGAMLRRPRTPLGQAGPAGPAAHAGPARRLGDLAVDLAAHEVRVAGTRIAATRTEFDLLAALAARPGEAMSRRELIDTVWDPAWVGDERIVDVHVGNLRRKLDADPNRYIETVRGVGYRGVDR